LEVGNVELAGIRFVNMDGNKAIK